MHWKNQKTGEENAICSMTVSRLQERSGLSHVEPPLLNATDQKSKSEDKAAKCNSFNDSSRKQKKQFVIAGRRSLVFLNSSSSPLSPFGESHPVDESKCLVFKCTSNSNPKTYNAHNRREGLLKQKVFTKNTIVKCDWKYLVWLPSGRKWNRRWWLLAVRNTGVRENYTTWWWPPSEF